MNTASLFFIGCDIRQIQCGQTMKKIQTVHSEEDFFLCALFEWSVDLKTFCVHNNDEQ